MFETLKIENFKVHVVVKENIEIWQKLCHIVVWLAVFGPLLKKSMIFLITGYVMG